MDFGTSRETTDSIIDIYDSTSEITLIHQLLIIICNISLLQLFLLEEFTLLWTTKKGKHKTDFEKREILAHSLDLKSWGWIYETLLD